VDAFPDEKPTETGPTPPKPEPETPKTPAWMAFAAWKQAHQDLAEAYAGKHDCARAYARAIEALTTIKAGCTEAAQKKLALCEELYRQQHEETKAYTTEPPGGKRDDVARILAMIAKTVDAEANPDKKE
jgi:hypothetical protein